MDAPWTSCHGVLGRTRELLISLKHLARDPVHHVCNRFHPFNLLLLTKNNHIRGVRLTLKA